MVIFNVDLGATVVNGGITYPYALQTSRGSESLWQNFEFACEWKSH